MFPLHIYIFENDCDSTDCDQSFGVQILNLFGTTCKLLCRKCWYFSRFSCWCCIAVDVRFGFAVLVVDVDDTVVV